MTWLTRKCEDMMIALAWRLPRTLVSWCYIRVLAHATTGPYSFQSVPDLLAKEALRRWHVKDTEQDAWELAEQDRHEKFMAARKFIAQQVKV